MKINYGMQSTSLLHIILFCELEATFRWESTLSKNSAAINSNTVFGVIVVVVVVFIFQ